MLADIDWVNGLEVNLDLDFTDAEVIAAHARRKDASPDVKALLAQEREVGCFWTGEIRGTSVPEIP